MALYSKAIDGLDGFKGVIVPKRSVLEVGRVVVREIKIVRSGRKTRPVQHRVCGVDFQAY